MRVFALFAVLAVALASTAAAPHTEVETRPVFQHRDVSVANRGKKSLLIDAISDFTGGNITEVIALGGGSVSSYADDLLDVAWEELQNIFKAAKELPAKVEDILKTAAEEARIILAPIVAIIKQILSLLGIGKGQVKASDTNDIIIDLIKLLIKNLLKLLEKALVDLQELGVNLYHDLFDVYADAVDIFYSPLRLGIAAFICLLLDDSGWFDPELLLELSEIIPSEINNDFIKAILKMDLPSAIAQAKGAIAGTHLDAFFNFFDNKLNAILRSKGIDVQPQLEAAIKKANTVARPLASGARTCMNYFYIFV